MPGTISSLVRLRVVLVYPEIAVLQAALFLAMIYRGLDYLTPPYEGPALLSAVEQVLPLHTWGVLFLASGLSGLAGLAWTRYPITALSHAVGVGLYGIFSVAALLSLAELIRTVPSVLIVASCITALIAAAITVVVAHWRLRRWRAASWVLLAAAVTGTVTAMASASGVYGWRTVTDWLFIAAVAHSILGDASLDAWRDRQIARERTVDGHQSAG
ncbi:hypothetical protein GCM10027289_29900 [Tsukamurella serpentis]